MGSAQRRCRETWVKRGLGRMSSPCPQLPPREAHAAAEAGEGHEALFEAGAIADRVLDQVPVGRERQIGRVPPQRLAATAGVNSAPCWSP